MGYFYLVVGIFKKLLASWLTSVIVELELLCFYCEFKAGN